MSDEHDDQYEDCPRCTYDENRLVVVQCEPCRRSVDAIVDFLIAAQVERSNLPRGQA